MKDEIFSKYEQCINHIQDYLEYRYTSDSKEDVRKKIMSYIDNMSDEVNLIAIRSNWGESTRIFWKES